MHGGDAKTNSSVSVKTGYIVEKNPKVTASHHTCQVLTKRYSFVFAVKRFLEKKLIFYILNYFISVLNYFDMLLLILKIKKYFLIHFYIYIKNNVYHNYSLPT
jgi:hypothetical protein